MRFVFVLLLTIACGIGIAFVLGWLIGLLWPLGGKIVFYGLSALWIFFGLTYPFARRRGVV